VVELREERFSYFLKNLRENILRKLTKNAEKFEKQKLTMMGVLFSK